ncbi:MAG: glutamine-hydrolyzing GMP synthase [Treponema sp.]|nr:glutamine-hydrolyzing GMP synthase [Treponema sp.]
MDKILILDFGSQTTALIGRRIRQLGVYTEILPGDADLSGMLSPGGTSSIRGIILSGSPESVYEPGSPAPDQVIYRCGLPLLGVCYGLQRMNFDNGGLVESMARHEYGGETVLPARGKKLPLRGTVFLKAAKLPKKGFTAWMSHGDSVARLAPGFVLAAKSASGLPAIVFHREKPWYGLQFHPEASHCENGMDILGAFVFTACLCKKTWTMEAYIDEVTQELRSRVGAAPVLLLVSGGVDSTVVAALLLKILPASQVHLMYMDTGLMRKDETVQVEAALKKSGAKNLHIIRCGDEFLSALKGKSDSEEKRKCIGDLFITIQGREVARLGLDDSCFLAQGTLYTDLVESGRGVGKKARVIKSHHNVGSPLVDAKRGQGKIIEPLDKLYKDEVRVLGGLLGVDGEVLRRHPFPGPGLAVRIPGEVSMEKCDILRRADAIYIDELKKRVSKTSGKSLYDEIWQAFAVLLPVRSVGVAGDIRKYGWVLALRAVTSEDGMTADVYPFPPADLVEISTLITNTVEEIGRVTYDVSSKPPSTIEWE